jgi:predicted DNA-binding transcriptional regulator AlpA
MEVSLESAPSGGISPCIRIKDHKARQAIRIKELGAALAADGLIILDDQARALGLSRSTAWAVLKANHKATGLTAATINRMLSSPELPPRARATILTYVEEKLAGVYGHHEEQLNRFKAGLSSPNRGHSLGSSWWPAFPSPLEAEPTDGTSLHGRATNLQIG